MRCTRLSRIFAAAAITAVASLASRAALAATGTITASLVPAVSIAKTTDMNFGMAAAGATTGTVVLPASASPVRSFTGGAEIGSPLGTASAAFSVSGAANATYAITLPSNATLSFSTNNMTVNAFTSAPAGSGNVGAGGVQTVYVGGTLNVGVNQVQGAYAGTFNVTVAYN
jgi:hypothetical protein